MIKWVFVLLGACAPAVQTVEVSDIARRNHSIDFTSAITVYTQKEYGEGSGTAWAPHKDYLVTAAHVCKGASDVYLKTPAVQLLEVVRLDDQKDLCLLKGPHKLLTLKVRDYDAALGEHVYVFGSPLGVSGVLTEGFAGLLEYLRYSGWAGLRQHISAPIYGGNSGGPVLDDSGKVVGVAVAGHRNYPFLAYMTRAVDVRRFLWPSEED